jgi:formylmethanofuran dehydrogenase subunit E
MTTLSHLLNASADLHHHLCPRQVLGVRMSLYAGDLLGLTVPQSDKRLFVIVETDGCAADGIAVGANCWVGRRTMRVEDYGKVAATFVDTQTERALRLVPRPSARGLAPTWAPEAANGWEAQLLGYQRLPVEALFAVQLVQLRTPIGQIISHPRHKVLCAWCGEEIRNEREVVRPDGPVCRACAGEAYYHRVESETASGERLAELAA